MLIPLPTPFGTGRCCLQVASQNTFFEDRIHLFSLNTNQQTLVPFCARLITGLGHLPSAPASRVSGA